MKKGIDVSKHQGNISWSLVKQQIDFAMLRAGYGKNNIDAFFDVNASMCEKFNIPFGVYWFSYAYTKEMAKKEAQYCLKIIKKYDVQYPVCFDFEYDSERYANKNGVTVTRNLLIEMASAFLSEVEKNGYYAMNYTNIDYWNRGFSDLSKIYDTWLAQWNVKKPSKKCGIWQYSDSGKITGIKGNVDMNYSYKDFEKFTVALSDKNFVQKELKLEDKTIEYLSKYKYADDLFRKIAEAIK